MWNNKKWIEFINKENDSFEMKEVISNYSKSMKDFVINGLNDTSIVRNEIDYLQNRIDKNNYAFHKSGTDNLIKIINGWLSEDIIRVILSDLNAKINGSDSKRDFSSPPTNNPDLSFEVNGTTCYAEITNINKFKTVLFDDSYGEGGKFDGLAWFQGRANKMRNLKEYQSAKKSPVFLINISDGIKSIMIKRVVQSNAVINPRDEGKWHDYCKSAIALDSEYFVFSTKGMSMNAISNKMIKILTSLTGDIHG